MTKISYKGYRFPPVGQGRSNKKIVRSNLVPKDRFYVPRARNGESASALSCFGQSDIYLEAIDRDELPTGYVSSSAVLDPIKETHAEAEQISGCADGL
jgi:hypothetical protein